MANNISFRSFLPSEKEDCLCIFDENCPEYFATNEREDYADFLDSDPQGYEVCFLNGELVGAYGLSGKIQAFHSLNWILISPKAQGMKIGHEFMSRAKRLNIPQIKIAASHLSAPFFAKYVAVELSHIPDGWGKDMHRIDMELNLPK
ncbi:GNAT family N-acetyltransferase [Vibrio jasicida]|uniref:GNAT family N-acetyltransferase n=1 Tax=Vibrio jasicida TaxID=766224 RepID=UPI00406964B6